MLTGDASVNWAAPVICCTAAVLANLALRRGEACDAPYAVRTEMIAYGRLKRSWLGILLAQSLAAGIAHGVVAKAATGKTSTAWLVGGGNGASRVGEALQEDHAPCRKFTIEAAVSEKPRDRALASVRQRPHGTPASHR